MSFGPPRALEKAVLIDDSTRIGQLERFRHAERVVIINQAEVGAYPQALRLEVVAYDPRDPLPPGVRLFEEIGPDQASLYQDVYHGLIVIDRRADRSGPVSRSEPISPTRADALTRLTALGEPSRPNLRPEDLEEWWQADALVDYTFRDLLPSHRVGLLRSLTWQMISRSAQILEWAEIALRDVGPGAIVRVAAVIGSAARGEASVESDVDWNNLLDERRCRENNVNLLREKGGSSRYCNDLAARDLVVRRQVRFDELIDRLVEVSKSPSEGYRRLPLRSNGTAGERLRAVAVRELLHPYPEFARTGIAAPILASSAPVRSSDVADEVAEWEAMCDRVALNVTPRVTAFGWLSQFCTKIHALEKRMQEPAASRHIAHGVLATLCQALLILQDGRPRARVPYWRIPLELRSFPDDIVRPLARAVFLVAYSRVNLHPLATEVREIAIDVAERALNWAGPRPGGRGWLSGAERSGVLRAIEIGPRAYDAFRLFC